MPGDYHMNWRGDGLHAYRGCVMCEQKGIWSYCQAMSDGQCVCPFFPIVISFDCDDGGKIPEFFEKVRSTDIPGMQDKVAALEGGDRFGAQQPVCVRNHTD